MFLDERALTERLIALRHLERRTGIRKAAGFVKGWLESRDIAVEELDVRGMPVLAAVVGPEAARSVVFHGHLDVVPAARSSSIPASRATASTAAAPMT